MRSFVGLLFIIILFGSCLSEKVDAPNVKHIEVSFEVNRIEQDLFYNDEDPLDELIQAYPAFMEIYLNNVMGFGSIDQDSSISANIEGFVADSTIQELNKEVQNQYGSFGDLEKEFEKAFQYYKYYFPDRNVPDIYTFISEYGIQRFIFSDEAGNDALALGLDLFLGSEYPYQSYFPNNAAFSAYLTRRFNKDHLVKKGVEVLVQDIVGSNRGRNLLEKMVHNGKRIYILKKLLPYTQDSILMEFTESQMEWCDENALQIWAFLLKEELFYETNPNKINKLVNPAPNHPQMPQDAPGRTGNYIGWKIVEAYMEKHPAMSLQDLIGTVDAQEILDKSKYKPRN